MPKKIEKSLLSRATEMGLKGEKKDAYVYGTLAKIEKQAKKISAPLEHAALFGRSIRRGVGRHFILTFRMRATHGMACTSHESSHGNFGNVITVLSWGNRILCLFAVVLTVVMLIPSAFDV